MQARVPDSTRKSGKRGFVTLLAVLIVTMIGIALAVSLLSQSSRGATASLVLQRSFDARAYADACAELALLAIREGDSFDGSGSASFAHGSCEYDVTISGSDESMVESTGLSDTVVRKVFVRATTESIVGETSTTTSITNMEWTETADF